MPSLLGEDIVNDRNTNILSSADSQPTAADPESSRAQSRRDFASLLGALGALTLAACGKSQSEGGPELAPNDLEVEQVVHALTGSGALKVADTAANLRTITGGTTLWIAVLQGIGAAGDGGGGVYYWSTVAKADDGWSALNSGSGNSAGWRRVNTSAVQGTLIGSLATTPGLVNRQYQRASGFAQGDGAHGFFDWHAGGSSPTAAGMVIGATGGQWRRYFDGALLNVRWFGAVGDGVTDDSAAINAALAFGGLTCKLYFPASAGGYLCHDIVIPNNADVSFVGDWYSYRSRAAKGSTEWSAAGAVLGSFLVVPEGDDGVVAAKSGGDTVTVNFTNIAILGKGAGANKLVDLWRGAANKHSNVSCDNFATLNATYGIYLVESYSNTTVKDHRASGTDWPLYLGLEGTGAGVAALTVLGPRYDGNTYGPRFGNAALITVIGGTIQGVLGDCLEYGEARAVEFCGTWFENLLGQFIKVVPGYAASRVHNRFTRVRVIGTSGPLTGSIDGAYWGFHSVDGGNTVIDGLSGGSVYRSADSQITIRNAGGCHFLHDQIAVTYLPLSGGTTQIAPMAVRSIDIELSANSTLQLKGAPDVAAGSEIELAVKSNGGAWTLSITCDIYAGPAGGTTIPWTNASSSGQVCSATLRRSGFGWTIRQGAWS